MSFAMTDADRGHDPVRTTLPHRGRSRRGCHAAALRAWGALLLMLQGCAAVQDTAHFAKGVLDPGVPGPKPLTAEAAAQLSDEELQQRLAFVVTRLEDNRAHAAWWYYGFLTLNAGGMAVGATTAATTHDTDAQTYGILNASLGLIGTTYLLGAPLPGRSGADPVHDMPSATHADRAAQLAAAEQILFDAAGRARQRTGWILHVGNVVLNAAAASVLLARESYGDAALLFFLNSAVGEAQILLTPWEPKTSWEDYRRFVATGGPPANVPTLSIGPLPAGHGLALRVTF